LARYEVLGTYAVEMLAAFANHSERCPEERIGDFRAQPFPAPASMASGATRNARVTLKLRFWRMRLWPS
jgi:hypothetical protein